MGVKFNTQKGKSELHFKVTQRGCEGDVRRVFPQIESYQVKLFGANCGFVGQAPFADCGADIYNVVEQQVVLKV